MVYIVAKFVVDPNKVEEFIAIAKELTLASRAEEGCLQYVFTASEEKPNVLIVMETWQSAEIFAKHGKSAHFNSAVPKLNELCIEPLELHVLGDVHA